jgi:hypothetical protein
MAVALARFHDEARRHLTPEQFAYCTKEACLSGCSMTLRWSERLGFQPEDRMHYEITISDWASDDRSDPPPRCWFGALVSRDRSSELCETWWHPPIE